MLSLYNANPALLNDDTEWNTPSHSARPGASPYEIHQRSARTSAVASSTANNANAHGYAGADRGGECGLRL